MTREQKRKKNRKRGEIAKDSSNFLQFWGFLLGGGRGRDGELMNPSGPGEKGLGQAGAKKFCTSWGESFPDFKGEKDLKIMIGDFSFQKPIPKKRVMEKT